MSVHVLRPAEASVLARVAADHVADGETARRLAAPVAAALAASGFGQWLLPGAVSETSFTDVVRAQLEIAATCVSTAWCIANIATSSRIVGYLSPVCVDEIWSADNQALVANVLAPTGKAVRDGDGWRLSGKWKFASGIDFCSWLIVCAVAEDGDRRGLRFFLLPREDFSVVDDWFNVGMRATGSKTVVISDVVVPDHRVVDRERLMDGWPGSAVDPSQAMPFLGYGPMLLAAPIVGAARGALRWWVDWTREKSDRDGFFREKEANQVLLTRCAAEIEVAELLLLRVAAQADRAAITPEDEARVLRDVSYAAHLAVGSIDRLFRASGSQIHQESLPLQRTWRDLTSAVSHAGLRFETAARAYAAQAWTS